MLYNKINKLLAEAMKSKNVDKLYVLKMIKAKFLEFKTSKNFTQFSNTNEISILRKLEKSWEEELESFKSANRETSELERRLNILKSYLPKLPKEEDIIKEIKRSNFELIPKNFKNIINFVQIKYPVATGQMISRLINSA